MQPPLVFVDIETTGGSSTGNRVLEVAALKVVRGRVTERFVRLLNPDELIPPFISQLTGITDAAVSRAPFFNQIGFELYEFLDGAVFVAHNVNFDLRFLQAEFRRLGIDYCPACVCTVELSREFYPQHTTHKLGALIERHNLAVAGRHRAEADAQAIVDFYQLLGREFGLVRRDLAFWTRAEASV